MGDLGGDLETGVGCGVAVGVLDAADGEGTGEFLTLEGGDDVGDGRGAVVVEGEGRAEVFHVGEVFGGAGGDDFVAGGEGELDGAGADAGGASPDEEGLACWGGGEGRVRECEAVCLIEAAGGG